MDATFLDLAFGSGGQPDPLLLDQANHLLWAINLSGSPIALLTAVDTQHGTIDHTIAQVDESWGTSFFTLSPDGETIYIDDSSGSAALLVRISATDGSVMTTSPALHGNLQWLEAAGSVVYAYSQVGSGAFYLAQLPADLSAITWEVSVFTPVSGTHQIAVDADGNVWTGDDQRLYRIEPTAGVVTEYDVTLDFTGDGHIELVGYDADSDSLLVIYQRSWTLGPNIAAKFDLTSLSIVESFSDPPLGHASHQSVVRRGSVQGCFWIRESFNSATGDNTSTFHQLNMTTFTIARSYTLPDDWGVTDEDPPEQDAIRGHVHDICTPALWAYRDGFTPIGVWQLTLPDEPDPSCVVPQLCAPIPLSEIMADLYQRAGLTASDYDVSDQTQLVSGYALARRLPAREALLPLLQAYFVDVVERDGKLVGVNRGQASALTIPEADLGAHEDGQAAPILVERTRLPDLELPMRVEVSYIDPARDFQTSVQHAKRLVSPESSMWSGDPHTLQVPITMDADQAKQLAEKTLYTAWVERVQVGVQVGPKYSRVEPADVVTIETTEAAYQVRVLQTDRGASGILQLKAIVENSTTYASAHLGTPAPAAGTPVYPPADGMLVFLDTGLLADAHDDAGFYLGVYTLDPGFRFSVAFKSPDDTTYDAIASFGSMLGVGTVAGTIPDGPHDYWDRATVLTVTMRTGALFSASEVHVLDGENAAYVGGELIQWQLATEVSPHVYELRRLLRGRKGTEGFCATHGAGETFVLLSSASLVRYSAPVADLWQQRYYKTVSPGQLVVQVDAQTFTNNGHSLMPYAPVQLQGTRDGSANLTITWLRRTRVGGEWEDYHDAPLGESVESYACEILATPSGPVLRTISVSTSSASYSAAEQTVDFGSAQAAISVAVYQLSSVVGRGYPGAGVV